MSATLPEVRRHVLALALDLAPGEVFDPTSGEVVDGGAVAAVSGAVSVVAPEARLISDRISQLSEVAPAADSGAADLAEGDEESDLEEIEAALLMPGRRKKLERPMISARREWIAALDRTACTVLDRHFAELAAAREIHEQRHKAMSLPPVERSETDQPLDERDHFWPNQGLEVRRAFRRARKTFRVAVAIYKAAKGAAACRAHSSKGECAGGHAVAALVCCGRPGCGCAGLRDEDGSDDRGPILARRCRRVAPKLEWAEVWAYVVVTVPKELRKDFRTKEGLARLHAITARVARVLRPEIDEGRTGVMTVNHEFGDQNAAWKPHGNALIPLPAGARYKVPKARLRAARAVAAQAFGVHESRGNVFYAYAQKDKRDHILRYVLRDTSYPHRGAITEADTELIYGELRGFRKVRYHGRLSDRKWKSFENTSEVQQGYHAHRSKDRATEVARALEKCKCPACEDALKWKHNPEPLYERDWVPVGDSEFFIRRDTWEAMEERRGSEEA